ncbi:MAG TPA: hypothetical protein VHX15_13345 [Frankiaceae bacterium]|nr:hypothetical protein [Frankiaceae bacterium]
MSPSRIRSRISPQPAPFAEPSGPLLSPAPGYDPRPHPWGAVVASADGLTLELAAVHGSGDHLHAVESDESDPDNVVVTLWLAFAEPPSGASRNLVGYPFRARVQLARPLGARTVTDGALPTEEQVREQEIDAATEWRRELGLPLDRGLVAELVEEARMPDGRLYGQQVLSDTEELWYRQVLEDKEAAANFAKAWLSEQPADLDGHAWITWLDGGEFLQYVTGGADELAAAADEAGIRRLRVETVRYAYRELDAFHTRVREHLAANGIDIWRSGPDERSNTVKLNVNGDPGTLEQARRWARSVAPEDAVTILPVS